MRNREVVALTHLKLTRSNALQVALWLLFDLIHNSLAKMEVGLNVKQICAIEPLKHCSHVNESIWRAART